MAQVPSVGSAKKKSEIVFTPFSGPASAGPSPKFKRSALRFRATGNSIHVKRPAVSLVPKAGPLLLWRKKLRRKLPHCSLALQYAESHDRFCKIRAGKRSPGAQSMRDRSISIKSTPLPIRFLNTFPWGHFRSSPARNQWVPVLRLTMRYLAESRLQAMEIQGSEPYER